MANVKLIPCRVCGKMFKPCGYCQSHSDTFQWRNFACSKECATKYINKVIAYRNGQSETVDVSEVKEEKVETVVEPIVEETPVVEEAVIVDNENVVDDTTSNFSYKKRRKNANKYEFNE